MTFRPGRKGRPSRPTRTRGRNRGGARRGLSAGGLVAGSTVPKRPLHHRIQRGAKRPLRRDSLRSSARLVAEQEALRQAHAVNRAFPTPYCVTDRRSVPFSPRSTELPSRAPRQEPATPGSSFLAQLTSEVPIGRLGRPEKHGLVLGVGRFKAFKRNRTIR
jgi:hypothetical protein